MGSNPTSSEVFLIQQLDMLKIIKIILFLLVLVIKQESIAMDLMQDDNFKTFIELFQNHFQNISHLPLVEQRLKDSEFIEEHASFENRLLSKLALPGKMNYF